VSSHPVFLKDRHTGDIVEAKLVETIDETHLHAVESDWMPVLLRRLVDLVDQNRPRADWPQSSHWNWRAKIDRINGLLAFRTFALMCEGQLQGLMQINTAHVCRLPEQTGKHLAYVDYVESAPWNRLEVVADPRFSGVGTVMIRAAIEVSREEGFQGRIGLHSLPRSEPFYARCGMSDLGIDGNYENLKYFEMTPEQATAFSE
jgi:hypothetical protein